MHAKTGGGLACAHVLQSHFGAAAVGDVHLLLGVINDQESNTIKKLKSDYGQQVTQLRELATEQARKPAVGPTPLAQ